MPMDSAQPPEPTVPYGVTVLKEPFMPIGQHRVGRWLLEVCGSEAISDAYAYHFVVLCTPCNEDGTTPCKDHRVPEYVQYSVTRLTVNAIFKPVLAAVFDQLLKGVERRLENSPECCLRHMLIGEYDGSPCVLSNSQGEGAQ
jgi:hypothetical protein